MRAHTDTSHETLGDDGRPGRPATWKVLAARLRPFLLWGGITVACAPQVLGWFGVALDDLSPWAVLAVLAVALAPSFFPAAAVTTAPRMTGVPVRGRWLALNSPASRVPSHGVLAYGQSHAIDLAHRPEEGRHGPTGSGPLFRPPSDFPAFGQPAIAPAPGTVVRVSDWRRDHRSRAGWPGLVFLLVEGMVREFGGAGFVLGNHVVVCLDDGTHVLLAHLRRGSARVRPGERVDAGQAIAQVGNSGNSTEPHVHVQLMDHPRPSVAAGLPMGWQDVEVTGESEHGIPTNGSHVHA